MNRRTFVNWMRNAAGLFVVAPEELLEPRRRYWPGADFAYKRVASSLGIELAEFRLYDDMGVLLASMPLTTKPSPIPTIRDMRLESLDGQPLNVEINSTGYVRGEIFGTAFGDKALSFPVSLSLNNGGLPLQAGCSLTVFPQFTSRME